MMFILSSFCCTTMMMMITELCCKKRESSHFVNLYAALHEEFPFFYQLYVGHKELHCYCPFVAPPERIAFNSRFFTPPRSRQSRVFVRLRIFYS